MLFWFGCRRQQKHHAAAPPPAAVRSRMERKRQKLVGRDKGSLTEQRTKRTVTTTIQKRGLHRTNPQNRVGRTDPLSRTTTPLSPPEPRVSSRHSPPPRTPHDGTWYGIPGSVWPGWGWVNPPGCAPSWILVKINPVLAEPRTYVHLPIPISVSVFFFLIQFEYLQIQLLQSQLKENKKDSYSCAQKREIF